jgi:hypothetical protein
MFLSTTGWHHDNIYRSRRILFRGEKQMSDLIPFDLGKQVMYLHPDSDAAIALKSVTAFTTDKELRLVTETLEDAYWGNLAKEKLYVSESMGIDTFERQLQDIVSKKKEKNYLILLLIVLILIRKKMQKSIVSIS